MVIAPRRPADLALTAAQWPAATLLGSLPPDARQRLLAAGSKVAFQPGQTLLREGERGDFVLLLVHGWFKAVARSEHGEVLLAVRTGGDLVGELGYLDRQPRSATVRAVSRGSGRKILGPEFDAVMADDPAVALAVPRAMSRKLRWSNRRRLEVAGFAPDVRLARVLHDLVLAYGRREGDGLQIGVELTQREVAVLSGVGEATTHRVLTALRRSGVIDTGYRRLAVLDVARLGELAGLSGGEGGAAPIVLP